MTSPSGDGGASTVGRGVAGGTRRRWTPGSGPERDLAVDREVEAGLLLAARDAEPEDDAHELHDHERHPGRVEVRDGHGDGLDADLPDVALDRTRHATDRRDREDSGCERAERSADAVHGEHVEGVVDPDALAEEGRRGADGADRKTDHDGPAGGPASRRSPAPPPGSQEPSAGVTATSPATAPQAMPMTLHFRRWIQLARTQV